MSDAAPDLIEIQIVYALPHEQTVEKLYVAAGTTVAQAIAKSTLIARYPELGSGQKQVGIYGKRTSMLAELKQYDRVEIYRPLEADPKVVRLKRARPSVKL